MFDTNVSREAGLEHPESDLEASFEKGGEALSAPFPQLVDRSDLYQEHQRRLDSADASVVEFNRSHLRFLEHLAEADNDSLWVDEGSSSLAEWLVSRYRFGLHTARVFARAAETLPGLPTIRQAFEMGRLSWDQLKALITVATPETDLELATRAVELTPSEIKKLGREVSEKQEAEARYTRDVKYWFEETDPQFEMKVSLPYDEGATFITALARKADQVDLQPHDGAPVPYGTALAAALVQMASESLAADADHDRATLLIKADIETVLGFEGAPQATIGDGSQVPTGTQVTNETLKRLICDARIQLVVENPTDGVIGIGRTARTIPPWLSRVAKTRDKGCRFPGCPRTKWVQLHHIEHWARGGPTDLDNLITLCGYHHRLIHHDGWTIEGSPNHEVRWINKWGRQFRQHPEFPGIDSVRWIRANLGPGIPAFRRP